MARRVVFFYDNLGVFVAYKVISQPSYRISGVGMNEAWTVLEPYIRREREIRNMVYGFYEDFVCRRSRPPRESRATSALSWDDTTVSTLARQLGVDWHTCWDAVEVEARARTSDAARLQNVKTVGVDEHIVRHEALLFRMEVRDLDRFAVAAAG